MSNLLITEETTQALSTTAVKIIDENTLKEFRVCNRKGATMGIGLSTRSNATFADCPIQLAAGEVWVETTAAIENWYAVAESGTPTINIQKIA